MEEEKKEEQLDPVTMPREELEKLHREEPVTEPETVIEKDSLEAKTEEGLEEKPREEADVQVEIQRIRAENEKLQNAVKSQDKLLAKLGTEVGLLRKKTPDEEREELSLIRDAWLEDPEEGARLFSERQKRQEEGEALLKEYQASNATKEKEVQLLQFFNETKEVVSQKIPDFESSVLGIAKLIDSDGAGKETIEAFKQNPYILGGEMLINLYDRHKLNLEVERLKTENEQLKKRPGAILQKMEKVAQTSNVSGKSGGAVSAVPGSENKPISSLSREELRKIQTGG